MGVKINLNLMKEDNTINDYLGGWGLKVVIVSVAV